MVWNKTVSFAELVRYEHTVFALPFAYLGTFLAAGGWPRAGQLFWITVAMVGARSAAMGFNRLIDRAIDAKNPRTANRHLPRGLISPLEVMVFVAISLGLLVLAAFRLNQLCVRLLPVVVPVLVFYSYTKRFTWLCHFFLGAAQFFAPFGGWIAVSGWIHPGAVILGAAVGLWVAGFDIIYSTQDMDFDRREGLRSIPARFGLACALWASRAIHVAVFLIFLWLYFYLQLGAFYLTGVLVVGLLLAYEHSLVSPRDLSRVNAAFFNVNGAISIVLFAFTAVDLLLS